MGSAYNSLLLEQLFFPSLNFFLSFFYFPSPSFFAYFFSFFYVFPIFSLSFIYLWKSILFFHFVLKNQGWFGMIFSNFFSLFNVNLLWCVFSSAFICNVWILYHIIFFSFICNIWMLYIYIYKTKKWARGMNCEKKMR